MQPPKLNCDQHVCVLRPQWIGTIWLRPLPLTWLPDSLVCKEAQHGPVKPLHTWPHGCNLARSVRGQITDSGSPYPKGYTQAWVRPPPYVQYCFPCYFFVVAYVFIRLTYCTESLTFDIAFRYIRMQLRDSFVNILTDTGFLGQIIRRNTILILTY